VLTIGNPDLALEELGAGCDSVGIGKSILTQAEMQRDDPDREIAEKAVCC